MEFFFGRDLEGENFGNPDFLVIFAVSNPKENQKIIFYLTRKQKVYFIGAFLRADEGHILSHKFVLFMYYDSSPPPAI